MKTEVEGKDSEILRQQFNAVVKGPMGGGPAMDENQGGTRTAAVVTQGNTIIGHEFLHCASMVN